MKSVDKNSETSLLVLLGHNPILLCIKNSQKTKPVKKKQELTHLIWFTMGVCRKPSSSTADFLFQVKQC